MTPKQAYEARKAEREARRRWRGGWTVYRIRSRPLRIAAMWFIAIPVLSALTVLASVMAVGWMIYGAVAGFRDGWFEVWDQRAIGQIWRVMTGRDA